MSYETELKSWGATGSEYPDNYNYEEGEQPIDEWDNFFAYNVIEDIEHLIEVTNEDFVEKDSPRLEGDLDISDYAIDGDAGNIEFDGDEITLRGHADVREDLNVSGNIDVTGEVDGVDVSAFQSDHFDLEENFDDHTESDNPHGTTIEMVRSEHNILSGDIDLSGNNIDDVGTIDLESLFINGEVGDEDDVPTVNDQGELEWGEGGIGVHDHSDEEDGGGTTIRPINNKVTGISSVSKKTSDEDLVLEEDDSMVVADEFTVEDGEMTIEDGATLKIV